MDRLYDIYYPDIKTNVRFRVLPLDEVNKFVEANADAEEETYMRLALEACVNNIKTDVITSLRKITKEKANIFLEALYNSCVMLNPGIDIDLWLSISHSPLLVSQQTEAAYRKTINKKQMPKPKLYKISRQRFNELERHLKDNIIGQDEAISELVKALRRSQAGLNDENRPLGVFMMAGSSGVGKTHCAKILCNYIYPDAQIIRIDCGEFQLKHEVIKLVGSPSSYVGYEDGSILTDALAANPNTVVLFDEIEKAHPDLFNLLLPVLDEGYMTDAKGNRLDFRNCIIAMTTNLGNQEITAEMDNAGVGFSNRFKDNKPLPRPAIVNGTTKAIKKHFRPEFLNRFDKLIIFNYLTDNDYLKIAELELNNTQRKLDKRGCTLSFDTAVIAAMVKDGVHHSQGARGLAQLRRDRIEDRLATLILENRFPRGTVFQLSYDANDYRVIANRPNIKKVQVHSL